MIYSVYIDVRRRNTAGLKAPADIAEISRRNGCARFEIPRFPEGRGALYNRVWLAAAVAKNLLRLFFTLREGDLIVFQHPNYGVRPLMWAIPRIRRARGCRFAVLIHDLESLRGGIEGWVQADARRDALGDGAFLNAFDRVIAHNARMSAYLAEHGIDREKLIDLELFDYLTDCPILARVRGNVPAVAVAGNLHPAKCGYLRELPDDPARLQINLYGENLDKTRLAQNMAYFGAFSPEALPGAMTGDFGLVWDGPSARTCAGNTGRYLRYNSPHKLSLYLASGMPVIVWRESAMAEFVLKNRVGVAVDGLQTLPETLRAITDADYRAMCGNVRRIAEKLRRGDYYTRAVERSME